MNKRKEKFLKIKALYEAFTGLFCSIIGILTVLCFINFKEHWLVGIIIFLIGLTGLTIDRIDWLEQHKDLIKEAKN